MPNSEQTNLPSSNHTYTKLTPNHIHQHYSPSVTSTHTSSLQQHPHTRHIVTPEFMDRVPPPGVTALLARCTVKLAGGPQAGRSDFPY